MRMMGAVFHSAQRLTDHVRGYFQAPHTSYTDRTS